ncbi:MAG: hypothetical protein HYZ17_17570 [Betaproteobacteria bacterium]|nr:hypothetical protein [Betaproteobacteria bacterium]
MAGANSGEPCWCGSLPPLAQPQPGARCWCPACLRQRLAEEAAADRPPQGLC